MNARLILLFPLVVACGAPTSPAVSDDQPEYSLGRLVVADAMTGTLTVVDLDDRSMPGTLSLDNASAVYASNTSSGGFVYATQRMQNQTNILESGTEFEAHEDHYHIKKKAPKLLPKPITGALPTHFTFNQGWVSLFNDGDGTVDFLSETQLARGEVNPTRASTGTAHHGVAIVHGERLIATMSMPDTQMLADGGTTIRELAAGATDRALARPDTVKDTFGGCSSLHGEYTTGDKVAFGCANGALVLTWNTAAAKFDSALIPNPAGRTERIGTVEGHEKMPVFVGNFDRAPANGLAIIDPRTNTITPMNLPTRRFAFRVDERGEHILVLTMDGNLHKFKLNAGATAMEAEGMPLKVMPEFAVWPATPPRPAMTIGWDRVYVSDPRDGTVKEISVKEWKLEHTFTIGGAPASISLTSMSPDWASKNDDHSHHDSKQ
jgi:hypothetical protein